MKADGIGLRRDFAAQGPAAPTGLASRRSGVPRTGRFVVALLACLGAQAACAAPPVPDAEFSVRWTEQAYLSRHRDLAGASRSLAQASAALCQSPSEPRLHAARERWQDAMLAWRRLDGAPAGAVVLARTGRMIDFRPARVKDVEARIARGEGPDPNNVAVRGLGTAEYLLWGDQAPASQLEALRQPARCAYLEGVAKRIAEDVAAADEGWRLQLEKLAGEVDFPRRNLLSENMGLMLGGLDGAVRRIPQVRDARREAWPDWRSASTRAAIGAQLDGFAMAYLGPERRPDASLSAFVRRHGHDAADARVRTALESARRAWQALPEPADRPEAAPRRTALLDAIAEVRRAVEALAVELDIVLGFNDNDGD